MEKSASQLQEPTSPPPPPPAEQVPPLPTAADQRPAELPSPAMDLERSPAAQPQIASNVLAPPSTVTAERSSRGRKRALEANLQIENSNYYKMRLNLKDLRPHVVEVLSTPDFRNCMAATKIQERMKLMLQLYEEMIGASSSKGEKTGKRESLSNGKAHTTTALRSCETSYIQSEKHNCDEDGDKVRDTVVGGSAFGWNFITHGGTEPVYCGMSKEEYRISHPIIQVGAEVEMHNTL